MVCRCACSACGEARPECFCPGGPPRDNLAEGSCPIHSWERPTEDARERGALDQYATLGVR